jgi:hypothetical protein
MVNTNREMATFMFQRVLPTMRALLNASEFDDATGEGFSCFACHTRGDSDGGAQEATQ